MKVAQLHNGTQLMFDPNLSDQGVDAAVRAHLGVQSDSPQQQPQQPDHGAVATQQMISQLSVIVMAVQQAMSAMVHTNQAVLDKLDGLGQSIVSAAHRPDQGDSEEAKAMRDLASAVNDAAEKIVRAVTAPKKLTVDSNGKPTGVTVDGGR